MCWDETHHVIVYSQRHDVERYKIGKPRGQLLEKVIGRGTVDH